VRVELGPEESARRVLTDEEILALARLGLQVEAHYGTPQDVEWAIAGGQTWLVQSRPITTLAGPQEELAGTVLLTGLPASPGKASGRVRILASPKEGSRLETGEVLVAAMTNPDWVPTIRRAAALVTDGGGMTCHAAIVSRELGVPCVVGTRSATQVLRDGEVVTVDGAGGRILEGATTPSLTAVRFPAPVAAAAAPEALATRLYVNLAIADQAEAVAALPVDGVGLLRAEFMVTDALAGVHPRRLLAEGRGAEFGEKMASSLVRITRAFAPRPVI
jgi:pyruvate,water dikinase